MSDLVPVTRPLRREEFLQAAELFRLTNDDASVESLVEDLVECSERWPAVQLGAFGEAGEMLGAITGRLDRNDPRIGWSDDTVVASQARGQGIGALLLLAQLEGFRQLGCTRVRGRSPRRLFHSFEFFKRFGFVVVEETVAQGIWGIKDGEPLWVTERVL